jgi:hypothetical protein
MASRVLNRRMLRKQAEEAKSVVPDAEALPVAVASKKKVGKAPAKPRKPRAKKEPPRMCARWCIFNNSMKAVAVFDYNQRTAADAKLAALLDQKTGLHFLQMVKEPMPAPELVVVPA